MASNADQSNIASKWKEQLKQLIVPDFGDVGSESKEGLGHGLYGEVCVVSAPDGVSYLTKKIHVSIFAKDEFRNNFVEDCLLLSRLRHPNVAQFLGVQIGDSSFSSPPVLISQLYPLSLSTCLQKYPEMPSHSKYSILLETTVGVAYLHGLSIVHGRLTPNNILLTEGLHVKIADCVHFGMNVSPASNAPYQAPEAEQRGAAGDVFSLGDIMLHVTLQREPSPLQYKHHRNLENANEPVILSEIKRREAFLGEIDDGNPLKGVVLRCLEEEPSKRPLPKTLIGELGAIVKEHEPEYKNILEMFVALGQLSLMKESVASHEETIRAKEEEIEALKQQMEPLAGDIGAKEAALAAMKEEMDGYKQALQSKEGRVKAHETGVRAKEALIKAKDREIAAKKQALVSKEALLKSAQKRIAALEQHVKSSRSKKGSTFPVSLPPLHEAGSVSGGGGHGQLSPESSSPSSSSSQKQQQSVGLRAPPVPYRGTNSSPQPYRGSYRGPPVTSPNHNDSFKLQRSNSTEQLQQQGNTAAPADPMLAKILARQQKKINDNIDCIHESKEGEEAFRPVLRKRSKTMDASTSSSSSSSDSSELKRVLQKRKSFVEEDN